MDGPGGVQQKLLTGAAEIGQNFKENLYSSGRTPA
jgi:hypothetical protein